MLSQLHQLLFGIALVCIVVPSALGQVQTIESEKTIRCGEKDYQLRLVTAGAQVKDKNVNALAIVLTPDDTTPSRVFGIYWFDPSSPMPSLRDDTSGTLKDKLVSYGNGLVNKKVPVVDSFLSTINCSATDPQVIGIQKVMATPRLLYSLSSTPFTLQNVTQQLKDQGVAVTPEQVKDASAENLDLFKNLSNEIGFGKAIRQYVSNLLAEKGRVDTVGKKQTAEEEIATLSTQNKTLDGRVKQLEREKSSVFSATPGWLLLALPFMSILSLAGLVLIGITTYTFIKSKRTTKDSRHLGNTPPPVKPRSESHPEFSNPLEGIIRSAQDRRKAIEKKYTDITDIAKSQKDKSYDKLAETILQRLGLNSSKNQKHSKEIINNVLHPLSDDAIQSRKRAEELDQAFIELQNELDEFQKSLLWPKKEAFAQSTSSSLTTTPEPAAKSEMTAELAAINESIAALKNSVDGFDLKVEQRFEGNRALQAFWFRLYTTAYPTRIPDSFVRDVGEIIDLYLLLCERCGKHNESVTQTTTYLLQAIGDLDFIRKTYLSTWLGESALMEQIVARIKVKMANDADSLKELKAVQDSLSPHFGNDVKPGAAVTQLIQDQSTAQQKLKPYHPHGNFTETITSVVSSYEGISHDVHEVLPDQTGPIHKRVTSLVNEYRSLKPKADRAEALAAESRDLQMKLDVASSEVDAGKKLVAEIALELNFKTESLQQNQQQVTAILNRLKNERNSSPYLQLRMGLSAALIALEKAISTNGSAEHGELLGALFIEKVKKGLKELLARMEECSGDQLWSEVLYEGFNQQWLHYLIRADLLLRTYYATRSEFNLLRRAVSLACSSIMAALHEFKVEIVEVELFEKLPANMEMEPVYPGLRSLPAVMDKVGLMVQSITTGEVVVDVTSFPVFVHGVQKNRGRASIANPSAWLQH